MSEFVFNHFELSRSTPPAHFEDGIQLPAEMEGSEHMKGHMAERSIGHCGLKALFYTGYSMWECCTFILPWCSV